MVAPVSGPFVHYKTEAFADTQQKRYRQKMPIDRPLEYYMSHNFGVAESWSVSASGVETHRRVKQADWSASSLPGYSTHVSAAYNQAYERLRSECSDSAGWGENIAQAGKARNMFNDRLVQMARAAGALRKGRFGDVASILKTPVPSGVSKRKALSQNFLEFEYGWKPLISDVQSSWSILTSDPGVRWIRGRSRFSLRNTVYSHSSYGNGGYFWSRNENWIDYTVTCRTGVRISNPNLFLANQLGFLDLALPWKLMPFSFVVDWFVNVEQVISSATDWFGVTLIHPHVSYFQKGGGLINTSARNNYPNGTSSSSTGSTRRNGVLLRRSLGIPSPSLVIKPFKGFSLQRGAQAAGLVMAVFGK